MNLLPLALMTLATSAAAIYAQRQLYRDAGGISWFGVALLLLGVAFGVTVARSYAEATAIEQALMVVAGAGLVHVPAAGILILRRQRLRGR